MPEVFLLACCAIIQIVAAFLVKRWLSHTKGSLLKSIIIMSVAILTLIPIGVMIYVLKTTEKIPPVLLYLPVITALANLPILLLILAYIKRDLRTGINSFLSHTGLQINFLDYINDGVAVIDANSIIAFVNDRYCEMLGRTPDEIIGKTVQEHIHPESREQLLTQWALRTKGIRGKYETGLIHNDGHKVNIIVSSVPLFNRKKQFMGSFAIATDITELRQAQRVLKTSEEKYHKLIESAHDPIVIADANTGIVVYINNQAEKFFGQPAEQIVGYPVTDLHPRQQIEYYKSMFQEAAKSEDGILMRAEVKTFTGEIRTVDISASVVHTEDQTLVIGILRDLTNSIIAEEALRNSERRFREMADLLPDMLFELDMEYKILYANRTALQILGYTQEDLARGLNANDILVEDIHNQVHVEVREKLLNGQTSVNFYEVHTRKGDIIPCEIHSTLIWADPDTPAGIRVVVRDITERERIEQAQRLAALGQLATGIAHEFNNLFNAMSAQAELTQEEFTEENSQQLIKNVLTCTERGESIAGDLLDFTRPAAMDRKPVLITKPIEDALMIASHSIEAAGIELVRDYYPEELWVSGDLTQLRQVFLNLIINALQAMPEGGILRIKTRLREKTDKSPQVIVRVIDTGTGISEENLPHVFEPFFTTKSGHSDAGTGMGLSVSHRIVTEHDGSLTVQSIPGQGANFKVSLDQFEITESLNTEPVNKPTSQPVEAGKRLLLAEDGEMLANLFNIMLLRADYEVTVVHKTEDALQQLAINHFDGVISDLNMPGGGGQTILDAVCNLPQPVPVIIITGVVDNNQEEMIKAQGATVILRKPVRQNVLISEVQKALATGDSDTGAETSFLF